MKYIKLFIITVILFFSFYINCSALNNRVYDKANLYSNSEEKELEFKIKKYTKSSNIDSFVITLNDLDGKNASDYAYDYYEANKSHNNGVVYLIYMGDSEPQIFMYAIGSNATKYYTDDRVGEILKYVYSYISKKEYYKSTDTYLTIIQGFYDKDTGGDYHLTSDGKIVKYIPWIEIIVLSLALTFIFIMYFIYHVNNGKKSSDYNQLDSKLNKDIMVVTTVKDEVVSE